MGAGLKKCGNPFPGPQPFLYGRELGPASESIFIERTPGRPLKDTLNRRALGPVTRHCGVPQWP